MDSKTDTASCERADTISAALYECRECTRLFGEFVEDYALVILDADGRITQWSSGASRLTGYTAGEVAGKDIAILYPAGEIAGDVPQRALAAARAEARYTVEAWYVRRDGSTFLARTQLDVLRTHAGNVRGYAWLIRDLSSREQETERFRRIVEASPSAMINVDPAGFITLVNVQAERMFGYTRAEMLGQPIEMLVPERFRHQHPAQRHDFARAPAARPMGAGRDLYALRKDGSEFAVEIGLNPLDTDEGPMILSAIVDISDRKRKEERIRASLAEKEALLGEIHHRVKNNLQVVHSLLELQSARIHDSTLREMLRDTQSRIQSMALIHQILYQSHDLSSVDFGQFLDDLVAMLAAAYGLDPDRVTLHVEADNIPMSLNKAVPCGLIVNELTTNSLKHAFLGGRGGRIEVLLSAESGSRARLVVRDDGIGIAEDLDLDSLDSQGLKLVTLLTEQLRGELSIHRAHPTEFALSFPLQD